MSFQVNFNYQNQINLDPYETAQNFCDLYYGTVALDGFSGILNLFDPNAHCNYNGHEILGMYSVMSGLASDGISKMFYDQLTFTPMLIDNERLIIQVTGLCQSVTFWGALGHICPFVETFVLKYSSGRVLVEGYIFKA